MNIPDGWKLVPVEPFPSQRISGAVALMKASDSDLDCTTDEIAAAYRAMIAAAPSAPPPVGLSAQVLRALRLADMAIASWENGYAFDVHGPSREAQRAVTEALDGIKQGGHHG